MNDLERLHDLAQVLAPNGKLYFIIGGCLARFLAERRTGTDNQVNLVGNIAVIRSLRSHGFRIKQRLGWHGPSAVFWHYAGQLALPQGRLDMRDRCHYAMRRSFTERGFRYRLTALIGLCAERGK
jgi:hypothetical protein